MNHKPWSQVLDTGVFTLGVLVVVAYVLQGLFWIPLAYLSQLDKVYTSKFSERLVSVLNIKIIFILTFMKVCVWILRFHFPWREKTNISKRA